MNPTLPLKAAALILACLFMLALPGREAPAAQEQLKILVVVNGKPITSYDLDEQLEIMATSAAITRKQEPTPEAVAAIKREMRDDVLTDMIEQILLMEEIDRLELTVPDEQVDAYIDRVMMAEGLETEEELDERLAQMNQTLEQFRERIHDDMLKQRLVQGMVGNKLVITDAQIEEEFATSPEYSGGERYHLRVIMVESPERMDELLEIIEDGDMSFAEAAAAHSVGPLAEEGGDMGFVPYSGMAETWKNALEGVEVGERSEPFEVDGMQTVLLLEDVGAMKVDDLPGMRDKIFMKLRNEKMEVLFDEYMERLKDVAVIEWK